MTPNNSTPSRSLQQDARAWSKFTGTSYTASLRQMRSPLAQGLLGPRVSARRLIATLSDHDQVGAHGGYAILGENGFGSDSPWSFDRQTDYIQLALIADMLRMFTPITSTSTPQVSSYSLKHTAEWFLEPHCAYVSNGRLVWAAAALGLPIADPDDDGPNLLIGVSEREHDYVRRMVGLGQTRPQAHHHRPAGYDHLRAALTRAASGEFIPDRWVPPVHVDQPAPFHDWLIRQVGRNDAVGDLANDYSAGIRDSAHRVAHTAGDLFAILSGVPHSTEAHNAAVTATAEWIRSRPSSAAVLTEWSGRGDNDHDAAGPATGATERHEYRCPCGDGTIVEEHDHIPGFRDHDVRIDCDRCRMEWRFVEGRAVRDWALEPVGVSARP